METERLNVLAASASVELKIQLRLSRHFQSEECGAIRKTWEDLKELYNGDEDDGGDEEDCSDEA